MTVSGPETAGRAKAATARLISASVSVGSTAPTTALISGWRGQAAATALAVRATSSVRPGWDGTVCTVPPASETDPSLTGVLTVVAACCRAAVSLASSTEIRSGRSSPPVRCRHTSAGARLNPVCPATVASTSRPSPAVAGSSSTDREGVRSVTGREALAARARVSVSDAWWGDMPPMLTPSTRVLAATWRPTKVASPA